jgi:hypothetical protein
LTRKFFGFLSFPPLIFFFFFFFFFFFADVAKRKFKSENPPFFFELEISLQTDFKFKKKKTNFLVFQCLLDCSLS